MNIDLTYDELAALVGAAVTARRMITALPDADTAIIREQLAQLDSGTEKLRDARDAVRPPSG